MSFIANESSNTRPLWLDSAVLPKHPKQVGQVAVDVCIVGAGIAGLTAADRLKRAGKTVAVIDLSRVGSGESSHTTAHLTEVFDVDYRELISRFGLEGTRLAAQSLRRGIEYIEGSGIDCDFHRLPAYQFTESRGQVDEIEDEAKSAALIGLETELLYETPLPYKVQRAMKIEHQAQFHPFKYLAGLAARIPGDGSYIFEETRMLDVHEGEPCRITTDRGTILADEVFVAANVPSTNRYFMHTKIAAYRTYAIAFKVPPQVWESFDARNLFWDINDPYHYIRSAEQGENRYLIVGGEDHKTGQDSHAQAHFQRLENWTAERFHISEVSHRWSGQIIEPVDGLPYIGRNPLSNYVYIATGFSGTGMTMGTVSGILVSDLILGNENPWSQLYDASRVKPLASIRNYISENIDYPSHIISDRFTPAQAEGTERLRENEGALVRVNGKKVAAYRDPQGELHLLSPVCPHLGCHVHWNDAEKSWDCPCHGSRFNPVGQLLNGPAVADLSAETIDKETPMVTERYETTPSLLQPFGTPLLSMFSCPLNPKT